MQTASLIHSEHLDSDSGYFHLTHHGWVRKDFLPFPDDRVETWHYEMEWPSPAAKEMVRLTRVWISRNASEQRAIALRRRFGEAVMPASGRHLTIDCCQ